MTRRLLLLNGLAAFAITIHHAAAYGLLAMFQWTDRYRPVTVPNYDQLGSLAYYATIIARILPFFAVPAFFFVSGYFIAFLARGKQSTVKLDMLIPRIRILAVPFILWTMIRYALLMQVPSTPNDILNPYFFIPVLIQFYLLSPFIVFIAKTRWKLLLVIAGLLQLSLMSLGYLRVLGVEVVGQELILSIPRWIFIMWPFWFPFGVVTGLHREKIIQPLVRFKWPLAAALVVLGSLPIVEYQAVAHFTGQDWLGPGFGGITRTLFAFTFILCFLAFDQVSIPFSKQFSYVGGKSLGVYLVNIPAVYIVAVAMYHLVPWVLGNQLVYQPVLITVGLGVPLLLMSALSKSRARGIYRYVFG